LLALEREQQAVKGRQILDLMTAAARKRLLRKTYLRQVKLASKWQRGKVVAKYKQAIRVGTRNSF